MLGPVALEPSVGAVHREAGAQPQIDRKQVSLLGRGRRWWCSFRGCPGLLGHEDMLAGCVQWAIRCIHMQGWFR